MDVMAAALEMMMERRDVPGASEREGLVGMGVHLTLESMDQCTIR